MGKHIKELMEDLSGVIDEKKWSAQVQTKWTPPEGFFKQDAGKIASGLMAASDDLAQAMQRLNFYINRAGDNLSAEDRARLDDAKKKLSAMGKKEDVDSVEEEKKVTNAQLAKAAKMVVNEAKWNRELQKLGLDPSKWDEGYMSYYVQPILTAIVVGQGGMVDNAAKTSAKQMLTAVLKSLKGGAKEDAE